MKNALVTTRKRFLRSPPTSDPPPSTPSPNASENGSRSTLTMPNGARPAGVPSAGAVPLKRSHVVPIYPTKQYENPAKVLEHKQFIEFGCGACHNHQLKRDRSGFYCVVGMSLWPDGTNKTCRWFLRRRKNRQSTDLPSLSIPSENKGSR